MIQPETIVLLDPTAEDQPEENALAKRLDSLAGKTVGLVDNTKRNSDLFLKLVGQALLESYGAADVVHVRKANANTPAPDELLDEVSAPSDAVVHAVAD